MNSKFFWYNRINTEHVASVYSPIFYIYDLDVVPIFSTVLKMAVRFIRHFESGDCPGDKVDLRDKKTRKILTDPSYLR